MNNRGNVDLIILWFNKLVLKDCSIKMAIIKRVSSSIWSHNLTNNDKVMLLKMEINNALNSLTGSKRIKFIFFVISILLFAVDGGVSVFA